MKQVIVDIPEKDYPFFINLVKNLSFVKRVAVTKDSGKSEILKRLQDAVKEVKQIKTGRKKPIMLNDFLNEL
jgi:hypothetical protein